MELQKAPFPESPPTLSPKGTLQLLLAVIEMDPSQPLNQTTLKDVLKIDQNKHANKLLSWLALRTTTRTLADDVLECRQDPVRLASLLRDRLIAACVRSGCTEQEVAFLGRDRLDPKECRSRLANLPLVRADMTESTRTSVFGCLTTLSDVLARGAVSRAALERRLGITSTASGCRPAPSPGSNGKLASSARFREAVLVESREYKREYEIGYDKRGRSVRISVTFDRILGSKSLRRLAHRLIAEARLLEEAGKMKTQPPNSCEPTIAPEHDGLERETECPRLSESPGLLEEG